MATIAPVIAPSVNQGTTVTWTGVSTADTMTAYTLLGVQGAIASVAVEGTFGSSTITLEVSEDGTNFSAINDTLGTAISLTAAGRFEISTAGVSIRPASSGGTADNVNVTISFKD